MEKASLGAFDQLKVKYSSSKSDSQNSLIINGLPGAFHHGENFSEMFDQVKIKQQLTANPQPWRQVPGLQWMSTARSRCRLGCGSSGHARFTPSRPDAADLAAERQPRAGDRVLCLGMRAALDQLKVKYPSSKSDSRKSLIIHSLSGAP